MRRKFAQIYLPAVGLRGTKVVPHYYSAGPTVPQYSHAAPPRSLSPGERYRGSTCGTETVPRRRCAGPNPSRVLVARE